jgi:CrcB protein
VATQKLSRSAITLTFLGGALGSLLRFIISETSTSLVALFTVNIVGALLVGFFAGHTWFKSESRRNFWSTGFAGGFTTMSAVAILPLTESLSLPSLAIVVASMVAIGLLAYWLGQKIGSRMASL